MNDKGEDATLADRRKFLAAAGRFAATVPPAMTFLLATTLSSQAIARSGGPRGNEGCGNGDDPDPSSANPDRCPPQVPDDPP
jgi:hypothetical protein